MDFLQPWQAFLVLLGMAFFYRIVAYIFLKRMLKKNHA